MSVVRKARTYKSEKRENLKTYLSQRRRGRREKKPFMFTSNISSFSLRLCGLERA